MLTQELPTIACINILILGIQNNAFNETLTKEGFKKEIRMIKVKAQILKDFRCLHSFLDY